MAVIRPNSFIKKSIIVFFIVAILILSLTVYESTLRNWTKVSISRNSIFSTWEHINNAETINNSLKEFISNADEKHIIKINIDTPKLGGQLILRAGIQFIFICSYSDYMEITIGLYQYRIYNNSSSKQLLSELLLAIENAEQTQNLSN